MIRTLILISSLAPVIVAQEALTTEAHTAAQQIFSTYCFTCHGQKGKGDGPVAVALTPKPRSFGDPEWQQKITNTALKKVILEGGTAVGLSPLMAPAALFFEGKPEGTLEAMVELVRSFGPRSPYLGTRGGFVTKLKKKAAAPQEFEAFESPDDVLAVQYPSAGMQLKAWVHAPKKLKGHRRGAIIFFHGGFALGADDLACVQPFIDAGYVVMLPTLRGENGNPGHFELLMGEVDDAKAAAKWLAEQDYVDPKRIYAFGHSIGGGVAALLSLHDGVPVRMSGSSGGLYDHAVFESWKKIVPFDPKVEAEVQLRTLHGNIASLQTPHVAYLGKADSFAASIAQAKKEMAVCSKQDGEVRLDIELLPGDHFTSLVPAMKAFLQRIAEPKK